MFLNKFSSELTLHDTFALNFINGTESFLSNNSLFLQPSSEGTNIKNVNSKKRMDSNICVFNDTYHGSETVPVLLGPFESQGTHWFREISIDHWIIQIQCLT